MCVHIRHFRSIVLGQEHKMHADSSASAAATAPSKSQVSNSTLVKANTFKPIVSEGVLTPVNTVATYRAAAFVHVTTLLNCQCPSDLGKNPLYLLDGFVIHNIICHIYIHCIQGFDHCHSSKYSVIGVATSSKSPNNYILK